MDRDNRHTSDAAQRPPWRCVAFVVLLPAAVYTYFCIPRAVLAFYAPSSELQLSRGFLDQTLAYVSVAVGLYCLASLIRFRGVLGILRAMWHAQFVIRSGEAFLMYRFGLGYSPIVFYHFDAVSVRMAVAEGWLVMGGIAMVAAAFDWVFRHLLVPRRWGGSSPIERLTICLVAIVAAHSAFVLHRERARLPQDFAEVSLADNWKAYAIDEREFKNIAITHAEREYLRSLDIRLGVIDRKAQPPRARLNLVTIYLEGFQANFTTSGAGLYPRLTPNLDRFAAAGRVFDNFYNAVTPTINSIVSSQCGILSQLENGSFDIDRGYTRNLTCVSDILHDAGYHQVFLGGAESSFSGKGLFLAAHHFDDIWGRERWRENRAYAGGRLNAWGLQDTDLAREAIARLPALRAASPFHLSLLTVNTHPPGYDAADCPRYQPARVMLDAIHCTDYAVGMLMDALDAGGFMKDTVVVVMGDHMMFPSVESRAALGPASVGWFGKVFMAMRRPGDTGGTAIDTPAYTPDFAPTVLDALGFTPVPEFPVGQSVLREGDPGRLLIAPRYQLVNGRMVPANPRLSDGCTPDMIERARPDRPLAVYPECERDRIVEIIEQSLMTPTDPLFQANTN